MRFRQDFPNGRGAQPLFAFGHNNEPPLKSRHSFTERFAHVSADHDAIGYKDFRASLRRLRSYTHPLFPVSNGSAEYQRLKQESAKPQWDAPGPVQQNFEPNETKHDERYADVSKHESIQGRKKTQDARFIMPSPDSKISKAKLWGFKKKMCRSVNRVALKTPSDFHIKFVPRLHYEAALGGSAAVEDFFKALNCPIPAECRQNLYKILVVLCLMDCPAKIRLFIQFGIYDSDLPLVEHPCPNGTGGPSILRSKGNTQGNGLRFKTTSRTEDFVRKQWSVLAWSFPQSDQTVSHEELEDNMILPYVSQKHVTRKGGLGDVYKVRIHKDYCASRAERDIYAVKTLKSRKSNDFIRERRVLEKLGQPSHSHGHLVALLATYKHKDQYHLIFPWAETDLFGYWERKPERGKLMEKWLAEQFQGLAEALYKIHRYPTTSLSSLWRSPSDTERMRSRRSISTADDMAIAGDRILFGRHGDIKPENILWYRDSTASDPMARLGILKIADFGGADFNRKDERSLSSHVPRLTTYRSPEVDIERTCSTRCDVWAMGCILLEFVTWYYRGSKGVAKFAKQRLAKDSELRLQQSDTFFALEKQEGKNKAKVKNAVSREIEALHSQPDCGQYFKEVLALVRDKMLVVYPKHKASENHIPGPVDASRLHPYTAPTPPASRSRRHSQGSPLQTRAATIPETEIFRTPKPAGSVEPDRNTANAIQQALDDLRLKYFADTSRRSTIEEPSKNAVSKRYSLPERLRSQIQPRSP